jgi:outer membrane protein assembly factor BamB
MVLENKFYYAEIAGRSKFTRALDLNTGSVVWEYCNGGHAYALASDLRGRIVHASVSGGFDEKHILLHCLNKDTGEVIWKTEHDQYLFAPHIIGNHICIGSRGHVALFDLETGKLSATHQIEQGVAVTARPINPGIGLVFMTEKGRMFSLNVLETKHGLIRKKSIQLEQIWSNDLSCEVKAGMVLKGSYIIAIKESGHLVKIDSETGECISNEKLSGFKQGYGMALHASDLFVSVSRDCARIADII